MAASVEALVSKCRVLKSRTSMTSMMRLGDGNMEQKAGSQMQRKAREDAHH